MADLTILGQDVRKPVKRLETFPAAEGVAEVTLVADEVTSLCPVTSQPDFAKVTIAYEPKKLCLESKSLKLYLWSFREEGVFCEDFATRICHDVMRACQPAWCHVTVEQKSRGGIAIKARAEC